MFKYLKHTAAAAALALGLTQDPQAAAMPEPQDAIVDTSADVPPGILDQTLSAINPVTPLKSIADFVSDTVQGNHNDYIKETAQSVVDSHMRFSEDMLSAMNPVPSLKGAWGIAQDTLQGQNNEFLKNTAMDVLNAPYTLGKSALTGSWNMAQSLVMPSIVAPGESKLEIPAGSAVKNDFNPS